MVQKDDVGYSGIVKVKLLMHKRLIFLIRLIELLNPNDDRTTHIWEVSRIDAQR